MPQDVQNIHKKFRESGYRLAQAIFRKEPGWELEDVVERHGWPLLDLLHGNRRGEFLFYLERLYLTYGLPLPKTSPTLLRPLDGTAFKGLSLAFMMGFITLKIDGRSHLYRDFKSGYRRPRMVALSAPY